jgi:small subunit ribosomal protein S16
MALKIRLQRHGASHRPFYRLVVTEATARRDGRFVEVLGTYEPQAKRATDEINLKIDRIDYWKSVGAKPTDTAASLIRKARREAAAAPVEAAPVAEKAAAVEAPAAVEAAPAAEKAPATEA